MNRTKGLLALGLVCLLLTAFAGCSYLLPEEEEPLAPPLVETQDVNYVTVKVEKGDVISQVRRNGSVRSAESKEVFFETSGGRVVDIIAKYGDSVKAGDELLRLANAGLEYNYKVAELEYNITKLNYDKNINNAYGDNKKVMEWNFQIATLRYEYVKQQLEDTILRAPIDGEVTFMATIANGDVLESYKTYYIISNPDELMLVVSGENAYDFITGREVTVTIKGQDFEGTVLQTPQDDPEYVLTSSKTTAAKAIIDVKKVPKELWKLGQDATVTMVEKAVYGVLTLPANAVRTYSGRTYVQVLENGVKVEKDVVLGLSTNTTYEITAGLTEGEEVIVK